MQTVLRLLIMKLGVLRHQEKRSKCNSIKLMEHTGG